MWLTHLEFDATNPFMRRWFDAMGERGRYVRYDARGCGPSEPAPAEISFDRWVDDLEAVAASVSDDPVNVLGFSQGAAVAIGFAVRRRPPSSPAVATGAHSMTTPSTSPWPSWPGRRSGTPPSPGRPPQSSLICQRPGRRSCRPSPTCAASASRDRSSRAPPGCPRLRRRPCGSASAGSDVPGRYRVSASSRWHACAWKVFTAGCAVNASLGAGEASRQACWKMRPGVRSRRSWRRRPARR